MSDDNVGVKDFSLWLKLQEVDKVIFNGCKVSSWGVRNSWEKHGLLSISPCDLLWVFSCKSIIPEVEKPLDFVFGDGLAHDDFFRHD